MPEQGQKLRQTCDTCRTSKVKCSKQSPVCDRCLVLGTDCRYGVSNRGGRWRNGEKLGARNRIERIEDTSETSIVPVNSWTDLHIFGNQDPSPTAPFFPADESDIDSWQKSLESDLWRYEPTNTIAFQQYSMPPTPSTLSFSSRRSSGWPAELDEANHNAHDTNYPPPESHAMNGTSPMDGTPHPMNVTPPSERPPTCSCLVIMLQMLQNLHQNFPQTPTLPPSALSALNYAVVLNINDEATACCSTMLRCSSCQHDDSDSFTIMASLIRKVLSLTEAWVAAPSGREGERRNSTASHAEHEEEMRIKAEVSLIGIRKMEEVLVQLKQAGQGLRVDYERLTCASLAASLGTRLKIASETLAEAGIPMGPV